ncbi:DUF6272 family protein [Beggiatoa leptomitoformis]|uniref:ATP-binding protein n=1 Tax=Beggiatoa leptomitoformis TaxID=288004 RepID=A0A2N9YA87_9GAMM|nr:DUF6272 family protein [Beggiatoa leptomitoformis]ALG67209.1 ATP-binding protein [Beggiatoa leptomitoformis]AUI67379.1 ATP-binding protein [Beggiatoa leptomitoformis]
MRQVFGNFIENQSSEEYLILGFSPSSIPLKQRWRNNGLSADFLADYLTTFFPISDDDPTTFDRQTDIRGAVGYIANELLENAMKFNNDSTNHPISIKLQLHSERILFYVTNSIHPETQTAFQHRIQEMLSADPQELYIYRLEKNAESDTDASGLGLLTMMNDYGATLGWKFETATENPRVVTVTTMAELAV